MKDDNNNTAPKFSPVTAFDLSDENPIFLSNLIRALTREMRAGFEMLREEIRTDRKQREALIDRVDELERIVPLRRKAIKK